MFTAQTPTPTARSLVFGDNTYIRIRSVAVTIAPPNQARATGRKQYGASFGKKLVHIGLESANIHLKAEGEKYLQEIVGMVPAGLVLDRMSRSPTPLLQLRESHLLKAVG